MVVDSLKKASIYVGTYGRYNSGSLYGKWMHVSDFPDKKSFYEACSEYHKNEYDPEFMFQDWEYIPDELISESWVSEKLFTLQPTLEAELTETEIRAFFVWCNGVEANLHKDDTAELIERFRDCYVGEFKSEDDYAMFVIEQEGGVPDYLTCFFNYKKFADSLFDSQFWFDDGFVFRVE